MGDPRPTVLSRETSPGSSYQGTHANCISKFPVFSLLDCKFFLCQFTLFVTITYTKLIYPASIFFRHFRGKYRNMFYLKNQGIYNLSKPNSLCFGKKSKFPVFSLTGNFFGHFPFFPCAVGTLSYGRAQLYTVFRVISTVVTTCISYFIIQVKDRQR